MGLFPRNLSANFFKFLIGQNWIIYIYIPLKVRLARETGICLIGIDSAKVMSELREELFPPRSDSLNKIGVLWARKIEGEVVC